MNTVDAGQNPPKKRGCFFYGCLSAIVLTLVAVLLGYFGVRHLMNKLVGEYTDTKPALIETVEVSPAQLDALQKRVAGFKDALDSQKASQELILSAEDINALIANDPALKDLKNKLFVMIDGDRIRANVSLPLDNFGPLKLKGRYLNGVGTFKASLENGALLITLDDLEAKGKSIPAPMLAQFKKQNLAQDIQRQPNAAATIQKFESMRVKDGAVILKNKAKE